MKLDYRWRLAQLSIGALVLILGLFWAERAAWRQVSSLRAYLQEAQTERFNSADRFRTVFLEFHQAWRQSTTGSQTAVEDHRAEVVRSAAALRRSATTPESRNAVAEVDRALSDYLKALENGAAVETALEQVLWRIENLDMHDRESASRFLAEAEVSLKRLRQFLFVTMLGFVFFGCVIMALVYRRAIAPLRSNLNESLTVIERHEKLASLGVFAAGIAHEIRNPLTAIKVRLFTLKSSHAPGSSEYEDLEVIRSEINRLERIVSEFLQFARPAEPELKEVWTSKLLHEVQRLLDSELRGRSIELRLECSESGCVLADPDKMKQVLINLVQNGAESMLGGGTVTLGSKVESRILNDRSARVAVIDVSDTGSGIAPEIQRRLFDPFFTTKEEGTGLGLAISARIIEKHGGIIEYETERNRGTRFSIILPLHEPHESQSKSIDC